MLMIKELRTERGLTQKRLAEIIGVKNYTVANWEQGRTMPAIEDLFALSDFFECSIDFLTGRTDETGNVVINSSFTDDEIKLLNGYRRLSVERKGIALAVLKDMVKAEQDENSQAE